MKCQNNNPLECCLFFTANSLARDITRMGEEEFSTIGMTPSYAFLLMLAAETPGITQKELSHGMNMAPSTVSRFIDALIKKGLIEKKGKGRVTYIYPTEKGLQLQGSIQQVWKNLYERYSKILGVENGDKLTRLCLEASKMLQQE